MTPPRRALTRLLALLRDRRGRSAVDIESRVRDGQSDGATQAAAYTAVMTHSAGPR